MTIQIKELPFSLPERPFGDLTQQLDTLTSKLKTLAKKAGTENIKFKAALNTVQSAIQNNASLAGVLDKPIQIRALGILLQSELQSEIDLDRDTLTVIAKLRPKPSALLIHNIFQYFLMRFDKLSDPQSVAAWLYSAMQKKGIAKDFHRDLLSIDGPKWLAKQCITNNREFSNQLIYFDIQHYASGRFLTLAKQLYFVEQLQSIPVNQPHSLLEELQKKSSYESRYDNQYLLGHKVLEVLIKRAPTSNIHESWLNVIMSIAGDPRVPPTHRNFQKWWSALPTVLNTKAKGWFSRLDLKLFLDALKDFSYQAGNDDLKRMFPSRKQFLEGLLKKNLVTNTRLYLSNGAINYLRKRYKQEHLPLYSKIKGDDRSIIHVEMRNAHIVEGSHSCYLWIYKTLHSQAIVFDPYATEVFYRDLTAGLNDKMSALGTPRYAKIKHNPLYFNWQKNAIEVLQALRVDIAPKDVLLPEDHRQYIRRYGAS